MSDRHKNRTAESERIRKRIEEAASLDISSSDFVIGDEKRRHNAEMSVVEFAKEYCTNCDGCFLRRMPPTNMVQILERMQTAITSLTHIHLVMPRGHGKSSFVKCAVAWAIATGQRHFVEIVAANGKAASRMLRDVFNLFSRSPNLIADFPEICLPISKLQGKTQRCKSITVDGEPTDMKVAVDMVMFPRVKGFTNAGAILMAVGFTANCRGAIIGSQRPDLMVFDDLQSREMAENEERVAEGLELINGDFLGSAGHDGGMAAFMTSTPIAPDDLSERIAKDPFWETQKFKMLDPMPSEWAKENNGLWGEYKRIAVEDGANGINPTDRCNAFYNAHRDEMEAGAVVLNENNYTKTEVSAIQHAMNLLMKYGYSNFMAEYQMTPQRHAFAVDISARLIVSRVRRGVAQGALIDGHTLSVAATDINPSYALTTVWATFDIERTCLVGGYEIDRIHIDDSANDTEFHRKIYDALAALSRKMTACGVAFDSWGIDASGKQFQPVTRFAADAPRLHGMKAVAMTGRAGKNWNPNVRSKVRAALNSTVLCRDERTGARWLAWNADEYKESAQRAWSAEVGAPGGCSLFDGGWNHTDFATQIANERLADKVPTPGGYGYAYRWKTKEPHDYGDCMAMLYALAGADGLNGDGCRTGSGRGGHFIERHKRKVYNG